MNNNSFPVHVFPPLIRNAIFEVEQHTQAPLPLIVASVLGAISLACQNKIDVCRLNNLRSPVSLFILTIAESGERKSTVDKLLMGPLEQLEKELFDQYTQESMIWRNNDAIFNLEKKALLSKLKADIRRNKDSSETNKRLRMLHEAKSLEPVRYKFIFNDATPAAIKKHLCGQWRSVGIMSDEAGTIFNGYTLNDLPFINKMWNGASYSVERKNSPEIIIHNARMTLSLMVQPVGFRRFIEYKGDIAKGIGFFSRCIISQPSSKQGYRQITDSAFSNEHLLKLHTRLIYIIKDSIARHEEKDKTCLYFSPEANKRWIEFYNRIESEMRLIGLLFNFKDYASKIAENMARIAALLHYFNDEEGDISLTAVEAAIVISEWYADEHIRIFSKPQPIILLANSEADELLSWIKDYCCKCLVPYIRKTTILQYGPNRFRNRNKVNELLSTLNSQGKIRVESRGKTMFIQPTDNTI